MTIGLQERRCGADPATLGRWCDAWRVVRGEHDTAAAHDDPVALLTCGIVAGPLFMGTVTAQVLLREGFDLTRHGLSLLSHGGLGWVQTTNFVVTGLLVVGLAGGVRRLPRPGGRGRAAAPLLTLSGAGLVLAGTFRVDSYGGFPPSTAGPSFRRVPWEGVAHDVGTALAINAGLLACLVLARRFRRTGRAGWARYCVITAVAGAALAWWPFGGTPVRLALVTVVLMTWISLVAAQMMAEVRAGPH
jgi:hypothetical protein